MPADAPADLVAELQSRGLLHQATDPKLGELLQKERFTGYIGFDPTAASLHVGSLLQILALMRLERAGHRPIAIVGGGTGLIGDPSGKAAERTMLTREKLQENLAGIRSQLERFLDFGGPRGALLLDNAEWLGKLNLVEFLRDIGKHFSVGQMVHRDSVKLRLESREQGLSFTEFSYALLQAFDFLELYDRHGCRLQVGGSDQWGNIVDGTDLIRRLRGAEAFGVTQPLVTKADGSKFGKSEQGNVWLDATLTPPFAFFQFWLNVDDKDAGRLLRFFTFLPLPQIVALEEEVLREPQKRAAQRVLADEVTRLVHGEAALAKARRATGVLFDGGDLRQLERDELEAAFAGAPRSTLAAGKLGTPEATLAAIVATAGLATSRSQARQAIESGGISLNHEVVQDPQRQLVAGDLVAGAFVLLRRGKKTWHVVEVKG